MDPNTGVVEGRRICATLQRNNWEIIHFNMTNVQSGVSLFSALTGFWQWWWKKNKITIPTPDHMVQTHGHFRIYRQNSWINQRNIPIRAQSVRRGPKAFADGTMEYYGGFGASSCGGNSPWLLNQQVWSGSDLEIIAGTAGCRRTLLQLLLLLLIGL